MPSKKGIKKKNLGNVLERCIQSKNSPVTREKLGIKMRFQNSSLFPTISKAILINALACSVAMAVTAGQVDDFEDTTPQGWTEGGGSRCA